MNSFVGLIYTSTSKYPIPKGGPPVAWFGRGFQLMTNGLHQMKKL